MGPIFGEWVLDDTRYELAFLVAGLIALLAGLVAILAPVKVASPDGEDDADDIEESPTGRRKFVHPAAVMPGLVLAAGMAAFASFAAFLPDYARSVGLASSGALFGLYALVSVVVRIFGARWPERLGPRVTVTIALSNVMIGLAILAIFPAIWALWAAALFVGLGMAFNYPSLLALTVNRASDRDRAWAISSFTMFFELGSAAGGLVIGALAQIVGKQLGFFGGVASCVIGLWLLRSKVVPTDAPDAGPMVTQPTTVT